MLHIVIMSSYRLAVKWLGTHVVLYFKTNTSLKIKIKNLIENKIFKLN